MGKINSVYYEEIDPKLCTVKDAGEFYFHFNLVGQHEIFQEGYERYEQSQIALRNKVLGDAMRRGDMQTHPKVHSTAFAISSLRSKAIIVTECY